jgi:hypothetical protein
LPLESLVWVLDIRSAVPWRLRRLFLILAVKLTSFNAMVILLF